MKEGVAIGFALGLVLAINVAWFAVTWPVLQWTLAWLEKRRAHALAMQQASPRSEVDQLRDAALRGKEPWSVPMDVIVRDASGQRVPTHAGVVSAARPQPPHEGAKP